MFCQNHENNFLEYIANDVAFTIFIRINAFGYYSSGNIYIHKNN